MGIAHWCRIEVDGQPRLGRVDGDQIAMYDGDLFGDPGTPSEPMCELAEPVSDRPAPAAAHEAQRRATVTVLEQGVVATLREFGISRLQRHLAEAGQGIAITAGERPLDKRLVGNELLRRRPACTRR